MEYNNWYLIRGLKVADTDMIKKILSIFCNLDKKIFAKYYKFNMEDYNLELLRQMIEQDFEAFCENLILFKDENTKIKTEEQIKEILFQNLNTNQSEVIDISKKKNELLQKLYAGKLHELDKDVLYKIKYLVSESINTEEIHEKLIYIEKRTVFRNLLDISFRNFGNKEITNKKDLYYWFLPDKLDDIEELFQVGFQCIITKNLNDFNDFDYAVELFEQADYILAIFDKKGLLKDEIEPFWDDSIRKGIYMEKAVEFFQE